MKLVYDDFAWDGTSLRLQKAASQIIVTFLKYLQKSCELSSAPSGSDVLSA